MNEYGNECFITLLKNLRLTEAEEVIDIWINEKKVSLEKGNVCKKILQKYQMIIENHLWNEQELSDLLNDESILNSAPDIKQEIDRICGLIKKLKADNRNLILLYISAYYAVTNQNSSFLQVCLNEIWEKITGEKNFMAKVEPLGGYQKFQLIGTEIEKYYKLEKSVSEIVNDFKVDLCI